MGGGHILATALGWLLALAFPMGQAFARHFSREGESGSTQTYLKEFLMPGVTPQVHDAYWCTAMALNETVEEWVIKYEPIASANRAHHMLLFGCTDVNGAYFNNGWWDCGHHGVCANGRIMYAWAKNAPSTHLPPDVGFRIGGTSGIRYLTLQIHYANPLEDGIKDHSGLQMTMTQIPQLHKAGIYLLAKGFSDIPPYTKKTHADVNCEVNEPADIYLFAYRVHAHSLGSVISGYSYDNKTKEYTLVAKGNPQWPQAFYPMDKVHRVRPDQVLHARCTWDSSNRGRHTYIGSTGDDEMCNLYLMYYTDRDLGSETGYCMDISFPELVAKLPAGNDVPLPKNELLEEHAHGENTNKGKEVTYGTLFENNNEIVVEKKTHVHKKPHPETYSQVPQSQQNLYPEYDTSKAVPEQTQEATAPQEPQSPPLVTGDLKPVPVESLRDNKKMKNSAYHVVQQWDPKNLKLGQVVAVALDSQNDVLVFHRGKRVWDGSTFIGNTLRNQEHPIEEATLIHLQRNTGEVLHKWGANFFFLPHGLTIDSEDNIWVTDVGLHQVFKFPKGYGDGNPIQTLGTRFSPGSDTSHFCKPSGVAVMSTGEFFVSDGYCNSRVIKYSPEGIWITQFGTQSTVQLNPAPGTFSVPHALTLAEDQGEVCVADRENGRVQCFTTSEGTFTRQFKFNEWGGRLFSVAYTPAMGGRLFAVNGPQLISHKMVEAFEVDFTSGKLIGSFSPYSQGLSSPHDIVVTNDGAHVYVVEIGPNLIWKFELDGWKDTEQIVETNTQQNDPTVRVGQLIADSSTKEVLSPFPGKWSTIGVSTVVLGLLAIPIAVLSIITLIIRARKTGRIRMRNLANGSLNGGLKRGKLENGLNLGSLLNKHHGFEKLATEDLDHDAPDSGDSDIEEFSQAATRA
ncbi:peptidyl-glycine alpha-amidating monooxygenase B-like isoform X2 [Oratosquilla oratoria]|uniref:peptidyl-glycine alpha-amidating monooxygenase B-like isoform X2 n=1 Tax=Oratosquilla oratoria TaxID=337810 RepID=UPI003F769CE7